MLSGDSHFAVNADTKSENAPDLGDFASSIGTLPCAVWGKWRKMGHEAKQDSAIFPSVGGLDHWFIYLFNAYINF